MKAPLAAKTKPAPQAASLQYDDGFGELPPALPTPATAPLVPPPAAPTQAPEREHEHHHHHHHHRREAKPPYGNAIDTRAAALAADIPLDPGNCSMSIGPDALMVGDIILSTTHHELVRF